LRGKIPVLIAVCGAKNSGKTTLLTHVLPILRDEGIRVAVIKHDVHDFAPDVKGTDSYRLRMSGALGVAVYSRNRFMIIREEEEPTVEDLSLYFQDMDLILLEGGKHSRYPKLAVARGDLEMPPGDPRAFLALCADPVPQLPGVRCLNLTDYRGIADVILNFCEKSPRTKQNE
jgi:molybdopterin-guanine dinucleotide biosynthesis protein B